MNNIKGRLSPYSCDQNLCPVMRERLHRHQLQHHAKNRKDSKTLDHGMSILTFDEDLIITPIKNPNLNDKVGKPAAIQTENENSEIIDANGGSTQTGHIPLRTSETIEVLTPNNKFYKEYVKNEIQDWVRDMSIYNKANAQMMKDNVTNELLEDIITLSNDFKNPEYDNRLKLAIEDCLQKLPLLISGTKDKDLFKEDLLESLFNNIKELNTKLLNQRDTVNNVNESKSTNSIDIEITEWLNGIEFMDTSNINKNNVHDLLKERLRSILDTPMNTTNYKLKMKGEIVGVLNDLPILLKGRANQLIYLNRFAEDLANRLLSVQCNRKRHSYQYSVQIDRQKLYDVFDNHQYDKMILRQKIKDKLNDSLGILNINNDNISVEITSLLIENIDLIYSGNETAIKNEISELIYNSSNYTEIESSKMTDNILKNVKNVIDRQITTKTIINQQLSGIISVYTSEEASMVTSTPKRTKNKKEQPKVTPDEDMYTKKVTELVNTWVDTLPDINRTLDDKEYKEVAIYDLAGNLTDTIKLHLVTKDQKKEEEHIQFVIYVWILKFNIFEDMDKAKPFVNELYHKVKKISVPDLNKPLSGNRVVAKNIEFNEKSHPLMRYFPENIDLIEDQISIWMNEQPSEIYVNTDHKTCEKMIHEVAEKLRNQLKNRNPEKKVKTTVAQFLNNVIKSKNHLDELSESLSERIIKLPDEKELNKDRKTQQIFKEYIKDSCRPNEQDLAMDDDGVNKTVKEMVEKYLEHIFETEDPVTRGVCEHALREYILKNELATGQDIRNRLIKPDEQINVVLKYVCIVSDWLKNLPVDSAFNEPRNPHRIKFVETMAGTLFSLDEARNKEPNWNYENEFVAAVQAYINVLPLKENQEENIPYMVNQLQKIIFRIPVEEEYSDLNENNLSDFIEEYALVKADAIADDELKLEVWMARLMKEIRNIARDDPKALTKTHFYNKLEGMPTPEECIKMFELELSYIKEISAWLRNLPLLPIRDEIDEQSRIDMISDLAENFVQRKFKKTESNSSQIDKDIVNFINTWIRKLPLDNNREIIVPILIQQIMTRIDRIGNKEKSSDSKHRKSITQDTKKPDTIKKGSPKKEIVKKGPTNKKKTDSKQKQDLANLNPGQLVVDAVETWTKNVPTEADEKHTKYIKDDLAKRLFKKIGEINTDPKIFGDDELYKDILNKEIDKQIEGLPSSKKFEENKNKMKADFISAILEARKIMKQKSAGDDYIHRLVNTLDASIPNPIDNKQNYDPGFELYKNKLANLFILSNFDHCNDDFKLPYEKRIREEVDKYFMHASSKNAFPLTKDQINNELFSALFKVPMPNEESIIKEVENLKTKLVIDGWYDELPLEEPYSDLVELLEQDKILSTLAKKVHELEREDVAADILLKEIKKWMTKFPFKVNFGCKIDFYGNKLLKKLNETKEERKCLIKDSKGTKGKGKKNRIDAHHVSPSPKPPSFRDVTRVSNIAPCCNVAEFEERNPTDLILEMIEVWFDKLPIMANDEDKKKLKTDTVTKMIINISELNANPNIFYDDVTYFTLINQDLDNVLLSLPLRCDFPSNSNFNKGEFVSVLQNIKPLIHNEKARLEYKKELKDTINNVLPPIENDEDKSSMVNKFNNQLVEEFVLYYYDKEDEQLRQFHKNKFHDSVAKYIEDILNKKDEIDPLILRNQLICELEKIPIPNEAALKRYVEEIRMKDEVTEFFDDNSLTPKNKIEEQVKTNLARKLFELERTGHTCENDRKIKAEIVRCTRKLGKELSLDKIDAFVNRLKETEPHRKAPPPRKTVDAYQTLNQSQVSGRKLVQSQFVESGRQIAYQPPFNTNEYSISQFHEPGYESLSINTTNTSLMNVDHLAREAERWKEMQEANSKRIAEIDNYVTNTALPYYKVDLGPRNIEMLPFSTSLPYQNVKQNPVLSRSLPYTNQDFQMTQQPFDRAGVQSTMIRSQALTAQPFLPTCGQSNQIQHNVDSIPFQQTYGPVNLSCKPCARPCPLRVSPDQVNPCNAGTYYQELQNNLNVSAHEYMNQFINNIDQADNIITQQPTVIPTSAIKIPYNTFPDQIKNSSSNLDNNIGLSVPFTQQNTNYIQDLQNNIGHRSVPCGAPSQPNIQNNQYAYESIPGTQMPQCYRNAQTNTPPSTPYEYVHARIPNEQSVRGTLINKQYVRDERHAAQAISSIQQTAVGTVTPLRSQTTSNQMRTLSEPTSDQQSSQVPENARKPLRKVINSTDNETPGQSESNEDSIVCKCGQKKTRKRRRYENDFEMCFGRLPKCFYY